MEELRLNKYLSDIGVCSRREADRLIQAGKVLVDGKRAVMGMKVRGNEKVICDGKTVRAEMGTGGALTPQTETAPGRRECFWR